MTHIVYVDPAIDPAIYTPPRGVVVRPISEHPEIVAESKMQTLPKGRKRSDRETRTTQAMRIATYFHTHPPADAYTIAEALGINWESVKRVLIDNPNLFRRVGEVQHGKVKRSIWGRLDEPLMEANPDKPRRGRPPLAETQRIYDYLFEHEPATSQDIADALDLDRMQVKRWLERNPKLFRVVSRIKTGRRGGKFLVWGLAHPPAPDVWCSECNLPGDICRHEEPVIGDSQV